MQAGALGTDFSGGGVGDAKDAKIAPVVIRDAYVDAGFPLSPGIVEGAVAAVEKAVAAAGGVVEASSTSTDTWLLQRWAQVSAGPVDGGSAGVEPPSAVVASTATHATLSLRVPAATLDATRDAVRAVVKAAGGAIGSESSNARDATGEFVDATARADTAVAARKALSSLLDAAESVGDVLAVMRELSDLTATEEAARATAQWLAGRAQMAALSVSLHVGEPPQPPPPPRPTPPPWSVSGTAARAIASLGNAGRGLVDFLVFTAVFGVPAGALLLVCSFLFSRVPFLSVLLSSASAQAIRLGGARPPASE
jgi:hypothetical protein